MDKMYRSINGDGSIVVDDNNIAWLCSWHLTKFLGRRDSIFDDNAFPRFLGITAVGLVL